MRSCPHCRESNPVRAKFCLACGAALGEPDGREARKTVTVLFSDMVGSTELGDRLDPESVRRVVSQYFDAMRVVVERHGGTVEKFIGDAIMAVFGIPTVHEDDALRALRAANEMRERLGALNEELDREWGVRLRVRIGVHTGEVVAGDPARGQAFVSGDTVNVAARLEQAAAADEILIGERTWRLGAGAIQVEAVDALALKGKPDPLPAWRLLDVSQTFAEDRRRSDGPFVGRDAQVKQLEQAFARAVDGKECVVATIVGSPGIGKSRLAEEFSATVADRGRVVTGHCLSYGEGITYWPLAEIVNGLGTDIDEAVAAVVTEEAPSIAARIAAAIGSADSGGSPAEIFWAFRKLFEGLAHQRPLIVLIDDLHWAEPTLLDLLEYVVGFTSNAPLLLLCLARPELFDFRPSWAIPRQNAVIVPLQPISTADADTLVEHLVAGDLSPATRARVTEAAEGNPLFIEQLLALNVESNGGNDSVVIPATLQALLAARVDRLEPSDRAVIERAAIEGRSFHRGAVVQLTEDEVRAEVGASLISLSRKEFIQPDQPLFTNDDGFRFAHILVRDAAYEAVPKQLRAELHERYALWLERIAGNRAADYDEILGYHLEQASRYHAELGRAGEARRLAESAAHRLAPAGLRAQGRGDLPAAMRLLTRAVSLLPLDDSRRLDLLSELGIALTDMGRLAEADHALQEAEDRARVLGAGVAMWRARVARLYLRSRTASVAGLIAFAEAEAAVAACAELADDLGLARSWHMLGCYRMWTPSRRGDADRAFLEALTHARLAGARQEEAVTLQLMLSNAAFRSTPCSEGIRRCQEVLQESNAGSVEAWATIVLGFFLAMVGQFDEARESHALGLAMLQDLGQQMRCAEASQFFFFSAMLAGEPTAAESRLRSACDVLEVMGESGYLGTCLGMLAEAIYAQGRFADAAVVSERAEELLAGDPTDVDAQYRWRCVRAKVLARNGEYAAAEVLAREAVALTKDAEDWLNSRADVHLDLAEVLELAGRHSEAVAAVDEAVHLYEAKENIVAASRARARRDELMQLT